MNAATAIHRWLVPVSERKTEVRAYPRKNRHAVAADQPLWKICQAESKAKGRESSFYAFFFVVFAIFCEFFPVRPSAHLPVEPDYRKAC